MNSVILQIASKYIKWILVLFALIALYRGHNYPGGGFIGGLLFSMSVIFYSFAFDGPTAKNVIKIKPEGFIALGLLLIFLSLFPGLILNQIFMAGVWISIAIPLLGDIKLGTPFLFDIGVFLAVIGVTLRLFFSLNRVAKWK